MWKEHIVVYNTTGSHRAPDESVDSQKMNTIVQGHLAG